MHVPSCSSRLSERRAPTALSPMVLLLGACKGPMSALAPAGKDAERIAILFWWMAGGSALVWLAVMMLAIYAIRSRRHDRRKTYLFVIGGGAVFPFVVLTVLLAFGLSQVPALLAEGESEAPNITVIGEQWWWRVRYRWPDGTGFETANELRVPVHQRITLRLRSRDVIHSFWVPSLAGKVDLIPGRTNSLSLEPTRTGTYRGICAEYCGASHAKMMFHLVVLEQPEFEKWVQQQRTEARAPDRKSEGARLFRKHGCGACHTVRGTSASGSVGPDLTHVGSREALGAGVLANDEAGFRTWLTSVHQLKPEVHMPHFSILPSSDLDVLTRYLEHLQ